MNTLRDKWVWSTTELNCSEFEHGKSFGSDCIQSNSVPHSAYRAASTERLPYWWCQSDMLIFETIDIRYLRSDTADSRYRYPISDHVNNAIAIAGFVDLAISRCSENICYKSVMYLLTYLTYLLRGRMIAVMAIQWLHECTQSSPCKKSRRKKCKICAEFALKLRRICPKIALKMR